MGFPHSEIPGSRDGRSSPGLIAAVRVLRRLLVPRHPPHALSSLTLGSALAGSANAPSGQTPASQAPIAQSVRVGGSPAPPLAVEGTIGEHAAPCLVEPGTGSTLCVCSSGIHLSKTVSRGPCSSRRRAPALNSLFPPGGTSQLNAACGCLSRALLLMRPTSHMLRIGSRRGCLSLWWWAWIDLNYRPHPYQGCALAT